MQLRWLLEKIRKMEMIISDYTILWRAFASAETSPFWPFFVVVLHVCGLIFFYSYFSFGCCLIFRIVPFCPLSSLQWSFFNGWWECWQKNGPCVLFLFHLPGSLTFTSSFFLSFHSIASEAYHTFSMYLVHPQKQCFSKPSTSCLITGGPGNRM